MGRHHGGQRADLRPRHRQHRGGGVMTPAAKGPHDFGELARADHSGLPQALPAWVDQTAYPFIRRTLRLAAGTVSYLDEGRGDPILFVHGTPTWSFEYRHLVREL